MASNRSRQNAVIALRESAENRRQERHKWDIMLAEAELTHQQVLTSNLELDRTLAEIARNRAEKAEQAA